MYILVIQHMPNNITKHQATIKFSQNKTTLCTKTYIWNLMTKGLHGKNNNLMDDMKL